MTNAHANQHNDTTSSVGTILYMYSTVVISLYITSNLHFVWDHTN